MAFHRVTEIAHLLVKRSLRSGDRAVDATSGNGYDTLFLAECVGSGGRVDGFDLQPSAIAATRERVGQHPAVHLHQMGHESMAGVVAPGFKVVMFNLGYLPGGGKSIVTSALTTIPALKTALGLLSIDGLLTVIVYPGHPSGEEESEAVLQWAGELDPGSFRVLHYGSLRRALQPPSPFLLAVERSTRI